MRHGLTAMLILGLAAQASAVDPSCVRPAPQCDANGYPYPSCNVPGYPPCQKPPCQPPGGPRELPPRNPRDLELPPEEEFGELRETGVFVAPPRSGVTQGPINRVGVEGMTLSLPEIRITTPRLELPALFRSRSDSRMNLDRAVAPYVRTGYQYTGAAQAPTANRDLTPPASRDLPPETCEEQLRKLQEKYRELEQQSRQLERALEQQRDLGLPPSSSRLQQSPEKQGPPLPPPDNGARGRIDPRTSAQIETRDASNQDASQDQYRPVGYVEPVRSQPASRPIVEPLSASQSVIREPVRSTSKSNSLTPKWLRPN